MTAVGRDREPRRSRGGQAAVVLAALAIGCLLAAAAPAAASVASLYGGDLSCAAQPANGNVRLCSGPTTTWDGQTKIDVNVILPPEPSSGPDGPYPVIGDFHAGAGKRSGWKRRPKAGRRTATSSSA
jgi:hypothetical protein